MENARWFLLSGSHLGGAIKCSSAPAPCKGYVAKDNDPTVAHESWLRGDGVAKVAKVAKGNLRVPYGSLR